MLTKPPAYEKDTSYSYSSVGYCIVYAVCSPSKIQSNSRLLQCDSTGCAPADTGCSVRIPLAFPGGQQTGAGIHSHYDIGQQGLVHGRIIPFHRRIHPEDMQADSAVHSRPGVELIVVPVTVEPGLYLRMRGKETLQVPPVVLWCPVYALTCYEMDP